MITLDRLTIQQGDFLLNDVSMTIPTGEYATLMGPTGCGKTFILEAICGLRKVTSGRMLLDGRDVTRLPASARQIGYVPQEAVLFPTMRVDKQIEFGLDIRKIDSATRRQRTRELADLLEIDSLLHRYAHGLSGGEKQRVALARALSFKPRLLCLDEPMSALDDTTRNRIAVLLHTVHQTERVTVLHVTHNMAEAHNLGTIHFRMENGKIVDG